MSLKTPLGRVLGLGAAGGGAHHWRAQRLSAIALVPLGAWLVASLVTLPDRAYGTVHGWLAQPLHGLLMALLVVAAAHHAWLGVTVIIEDYVHTTTSKVAALLVAQFLYVVVGAGALFAVLKVALGGWA